MPYDDKLVETPLVKKPAYIAHYQADLLFPIARQNNRSALNVPAVLPFQGYDIWNGYELSWLNAKGKPVVAYAEFIVPCDTPHLIESKSFKLYLNSFNNTRFASFDEVENVLRKDLSAATGGSVAVKLMAVNFAPMQIVRRLSGILLDELDIECDTYTLHPNYLNI
jgi:7-cyano-7-deazaguanine reductase